MLDLLAKIPPDSDRDLSSGPLSNNVFVFTGGLSSMARERAQSIVESLGGKSSGSLSKKTNVLVAGADAGSKLSKARELGIDVWSEDDFLEFLKSHDFSWE